MSELPRELIELPGCTAPQRALFREAVRHGRTLPLEHVEPAVADALRRPNALMAELDEADTARLLELWESTTAEGRLDEQWELDDHASRLPPRWAALLPDLIQRDRAGVEVGDPGLARLIRSLVVRGAARSGEQPVPTILAALGELGESDRQTWLVAVGAALVASGRDALGARRTARLIMASRDSERWGADAVERANVAPSEEWVERYRELLVALADHDARERLRRMGIYVVAMVCARELQRSWQASQTSGIPPELRALIESYADSVRRSTRRGLSEEAGRFLEVIGANTDG